MIYETDCFALQMNFVNIYVENDADFSGGRWCF